MIFFNRIYPHFSPTYFVFLHFSFDLQNIERERYRDQLRRLNLDLGRQNSTHLQEEGERYKNGTTKSLSGKWNTTEVLSTPSNLPKN